MCGWSREKGRVEAGTRRHSGGRAGLGICVSREARTGVAHKIFPAPGVRDRMLSWAAPVSDIICYTLRFYARVLGRSRLGLSRCPRR